MRKFILCTAMGLIMNSPIIAQHHGQGKKGSRADNKEMKHNRVQDRLEMLQKELALSEDQTAQVKAALEDFEKKMDSGESLNSETERKNLKLSADAALEVKLKSILTEDQFTKYKAKEEEMKVCRNRSGSPSK